MKIRKTCSAVVAMTVVGIFVLGATLGTRAQGRYSNQYSRTDVSNIIRNMEQNSDEFRTDFRREMGNSNLNSSTRNRFNGYVASCENAIDDLRNHFDRNDSWWESRSRVQTVVNASRNVNTMMTTLAFRRQLERQWNQLRNQINRVADTYDLPGLNGGGWNGGGGSNPGNPGGGWNGNPNRPPSWMVGTFYSSYPRITLTIERGGRATANLDGQSYTGGYVNGRLYINNDWSTVTRSGNGIRTYNQNTGATTDYSRGSGGGGGGWEGPSSAPPSWAIGTFYADNGDASMLITRDGRVTINYQGQAYNGRYYAGQIYSNNDVSSVSQTSAGFQTYNRNTGERINYRRRR